MKVFLLFLFPPPASWHHSLDIVYPPPPHPLFPHTTSQLGTGETRSKTHHPAPGFVLSFIPNPALLKTLKKRLGPKRFLRFIQTHELSPGVLTLAGNSSYPTPTYNLA